MTSVRLDFPHPVNPDPQTADAEKLAWGRRYGMDGDPTLWKRFLGADCSRIITYCYPEAHGADLELAVDMMSFFFLVDELFDGPLRTTHGEAAAFVHRLLAVLDPAAVPSPAPAVAAFEEVWTKSLHGTSHQWQLRAAAHWTQYFWGNLTENVDRARTAPFSLESYLTARRDTIGYRPCQDMIERACGFEVPAQAWYQSSVRRFSDLANDLIVLCNDVISLPKELDRGETVNSVLLLAEARGLTTSEALAEIDAAIRHRSDAFHETTAEVLRLGDVLGLAAPERESLRRWVEGNHTWIGGQKDWHLEISRYAAGADPVHPNDAYLRTLI